MKKISKKGFGVVVLAVVMAMGVGALAETSSNHKKSSSISKSTSSKSSGRAALPNRSADPYLGAIVVDAATGQVLFEQNADSTGFPASVIKLMDMMVLFDRISAGQLNLSNSVSVTAESSKIGGSQVYLKEGEVFLLEDLMYALMIQSANDSAMAMALSVAGSSAGFVEMMNKKAVELGMTHTRFNSVHGLPPSTGKAGDTSTARDLAKLACALITRHPDVLKYTSTEVRDFRPGSPARIEMRNHNHLLHDFAGCDGLKTGFITAGGFSIVATAQRDGRRVIAVVLGSKDRKVRDAKTKELLARGFAALPPLPPPPPPVVDPVLTNMPPAQPMLEDQDVNSEGPRVAWWQVFGMALGIAAVVLVIGGYFLRKRPRNDF